MPLCKKPQYIPEPTPLQCGQAVLAMLGGVTVETVIQMVGNERETTLHQMFDCLRQMGIAYNPVRKPVNDKSELPPICLLSLETPRCWHWSLYVTGSFFDPEHGILNDFPTCKRKYYWEIPVSPA